jgi:hypothetical protein
VHGEVEQHRFTNEQPLEIDPESSLRVKMRVAPPNRDGSPGGLVACTHFEVEGVRASAGKKYSLVKCTLETGRQHQIRVHLAAVGHPIVGEKLYGSDDRIFAGETRGPGKVKKVATREIDKVYLAIVHGEVEQHRFTNEQPLEIEHRPLDDRGQVLHEQGSPGGILGRQRVRIGRKVHADGVTRDRAAEVFPQFLLGPLRVGFHLLVEEPNFIFVVRPPVANPSSWCPRQMPNVGKPASRNSRIAAIA